MKDANILSNLFNFGTMALFAVAALLTFHQTTFAQELDRNSAVSAIQQQSDAMRKELIQSYRNSAQFGELIAYNAKVKGSAKRLAEKMNRPMNRPSVDWENEAKELDGLVYQLESLIEEANFNFAGAAPIQTSTYLGNMLAAVESIKNPNASAIGETGLTDSDVVSFFESGYDPIQANDPAPEFAPNSIVKPASQSTVVDDPFAIDAPAISSREPIPDFNQQPALGPPPVLDTPPAFGQPLIEQPIIMNGQTDNTQSSSVLEFDSPSIESTIVQAPTIEAPSIEVPRFQDEVQPPMLEMPNIVAPTPELVQPQVQRPRVTLRPELIPSQRTPQLVAPRPYPSALAPRPMRTAQIEVLLVRPNYIPYGGYGSTRYRTGYVPYGGLNVRGGGYGGQRYCPYGR